jgi:hypothetical protein
MVTVAVTPGARPVTVTSPFEAMETEPVVVVVVYVLAAL